jgi:hypothetical protein
MLTGSSNPQEVLISATFSVHEKGCLVGGGNPSFKHASHEAQHFTSHMSADTVHLCSCVSADHGFGFRSGSHAPAQSVPSPRCGRPLAPLVQAFLSPVVVLAISSQGCATALQSLSAPGVAFCTSGFARRELVAITRPPTPKLSAVPCRFPL